MKLEEQIEKLATFDLLLNDGITIDHLVHVNSPEYSVHIQHTAMM